ncbi:MAG: ankyrin repeat domain-containing protein, partial [Verrucomicrobiota bacterium]
MVQPLITTSTSGLSFEATTVPPSTETKKIVELFSQNIRFLPICRETIDGVGRKMRLWEVPGTDFFCGTILHPNGQITLIPAHKIINPLQGPSSIQTIRKIKQLENRHWKLAYLDTHDQLSIWPHIAAAAQGDGSEKSIFFPPNDGQVKHMFRNDEGHFPDTSANRNLILHAVRPENKIGNLFANPSIEVYYKKISDNQFVWVYVKANGEITNAGCNKKHWSWNTKGFPRGQGRLENPDGKYPSSNPPRGGGGGGGRRAPNQAHTANQPHPKIGVTPANKNFQEVLQQTKLTDSYNTTHRGNPVPAKGGTGGAIGGVACGVDYIQGLFDKAESVFEKDHYFCVPLIDGQIPFSQEQLRQILRELAIAIYVHGAVPFFSLHFNQNAELFSVMDPAYQNTMVGRVIGMLDYFMKGYLNGGVFQEEFIDNWKAEPKSIVEKLYDWWWPTVSSNQPVEEEQPTSLLGVLYSWWWPSSNAQQAPLDKLIDFEEYCRLHLKGEDKKYISVRGMQQELKVRSLLQRLAIALNKEEPKELSDFDGFKNSFRIIAKQNSFQKEDNLFVIDADFDVLYTIEPSPMYQEKLEEYFRKHGEMPASYLELIAVYEFMSKKIHDHMVKMPMCREYFAMLGIINFFSSYFSTLKKHHKLPELSAFEKIDARGCPPLFPHLPLSTSATEFIRTNKHVILTNSLKNKEQSMKSSFARLYDHLMNDRDLESFDKGETQALYHIILKELESNIFDLASPPFKRFLVKNKEKLVLAFEGPAKTVLNILFKNFEQTIGFNKRIPQRRRTPKLELINYFLSEICQRIPNEIENISDKLSYHSLFNANVVSTEELEKNKRIVGGCGMQLKEQRVQSSSKASFILENNHLPLDPETWEKVSMGTSEGAVFRLGMEDIPHGIIGDYSWMESLLQEKIEPELMQSWVEIQQAMELEDREEFKKCVKAAADLSKVKGPHKTSLLHRAAKNKDPYYVKYLLKKDLSALTRDANGYLPVHYASMMGCMDVLKLFIEDDDEDDSMLDAVSIHGASALITAIQHNQEAAVDYLLKNRTKAAVLTGGYTELHCALHEGN